MPRNPKSTQVWLIGSGIASLAAAVHLIKDAKVLAPNIHILDVHKGSGGGIKSCGDAEKGYTLYAGCLPYFHGKCVEDLLSHVPSTEVPGKSILDTVKDLEREDSIILDGTATTRVLNGSGLGLEIIDARSLHIGSQQRLELLKIILESEKALSGRQIQDFFDETFFRSKFWTLWSTTFALQPSHSVVEFRRCLRKHLSNIQHLNNVQTIDETQYTVYESIIMPITTYLKDEGVDFHFDTKVIDLLMNPQGDPTTVSEIVVEDGAQSIVISGSDIVIATIGSSNSGVVLGSNLTPPLLLSQSETLTDSAWSLWLKLSQKSPKFGDPLNFDHQNTDSTLECFTVTLRNSEFIKLYEKLTHDRPGSGSLLSLADSNWSLSINIPHQPVCSNQPPNVQVIWGYGLKPEKLGNFVTKPMLECTGEEIMTELLSHLGFPVESMLPTSNAIPCVMPLATSPLLPRLHHHRPEVVPPRTTNLALIGQFVEITEDTALGMEYSVRSAQMAVYKLMGIAKKPPRVKTNILLDVLDLLHVI